MANVTRFGFERSENSQKKREITGYYLLPSLTPVSLENFDTTQET